MKSTKNKKNAVIFGQTNGFSVVMTALTKRNLERVGYTVKKTVCNYCPVPKDLTKVTDCGTAYATLFWGITFPNYDFQSLNAGDLVVIVNIPIGDDKIRYPSVSVTEGINRIKELSMKKIRVWIIDRHKNAVTLYGAARTAGATILISSSASTTHFGEPDKNSLFWGRIGAISVRDSGELPVTRLEERMANALDECVKDSAISLDRIIDAIIRDDVAWFFQFRSDIPEPDAVIRKKHVVAIPRLAKSNGFKQLSDACEKYKTEYAVGIIGESSSRRILVVTGWKSSALPAAFRLDKLDPRQDVRAFYDGQPYSKERFDEIIRVLDTSLEVPEKFEKEIPLKKSSWFYEDIAIFMRQIGKFGIPPYLTTHGWPHVENVLCHVRTLGSLYNLPNEKQHILEWAALLHDIGRGANMIYPDVSHDEAQEHHEVYSGNLIEEWFDRGAFDGLLTKEEKGQVVTLCRSHRQDSLLPEEKDLRFMSVLLRIADAMDVDKRRAQKNDRNQTYEEVTHDPEWRESSRPHWLGHRAIQSLRIYDDQHGITFELIVTNPKDAESTITRFRNEFLKMPGFHEEDIQVVTIE